MNMMGTTTDPIRASLSKLTGRKLDPPPRNGAGILLVGSENFRKSAALTEDGKLYVVPEYNTAPLWEELHALSREYAMPQVVEHCAASVAEVRNLYRDGNNGSTAFEAELTPGARRLMQVLGEAAELGASDIKIYVRSTHGELRMKLGAVEKTHGTQWHVSEAMEAITWIYDSRDFGDGAATQVLGQHQSFGIGEQRRVSLPRGVAALRGQRGFHGDGRDFLVLRLIYNDGSGGVQTLEDLGFDDDVLEVLEEERSSQSGLVIIGGSTGDGKSTTLVRQLERIVIERDDLVSIVTVEDPVEYPIAGSGVLQIPVPGAPSAQERSQHFAQTLRCFVRINPDIGMISEIRSVDDAREILQFVISGHKIFTTVHSFSANSVLFRLISLGVAPQELAEPGVVSLVLRQRLVPALCDGCATPITDARELEIIERWVKQSVSQSVSRNVSHNADRLKRGITDKDIPRRRNRNGCTSCLSADCDETARVAWGGLARKRAVAEFIRPDDQYRACLEDRDARKAFAHWQRPVAEGGLGGRTVQDRICDLVVTGKVDFEDASHLSLDTLLGRGV